jgi:hypothetical protein
MLRGKLVTELKETEVFNISIDYYFLGFTSVHLFLVPPPLAAGELFKLSFALLVVASLLS